MRREAIRRLLAGGTGLAVGWAVSASVAMGAAITTVAGGGTAAGDGVPAREASLGSPIGLAPAANGFVVAEQARHRIRRVVAGGMPLTDTGPIATIAGTGAFGGGTPVLGGSPTAVPLQLPCCLATTAAGALLVADTFGGMVHRVTAGRLDTVAGTGTPSSCPPAPPSGVAALTAQLCFVVGVGAHPAEGRFLVAEAGLPDQDRAGGARVYEVDAGGTLRIVAGGGCPSQPAAPGPLQLCLADPRGPVYTGSGTEFLVADRGGHAVWKISSTHPVTAAATRIAGAPGADAASLGDGGPAGAARLAAPSDLSIVPAGGYLIADRDNCRVRRVAGLTAASLITTVAGTTCNATAPSGDGGEATSAVLLRPLGVAFSPAGILVSDSGRGHVRLVERTTLTGGPWGVVATRDAEFEFEALEPRPALRCALDDGSFEPCSSPWPVGGLADGPHEFRVLDAAVPADPTPALRRWTVDTRPPRPFRRLGPADGEDGLPARPRFAWEQAQDETSAIARYEIWVDGRRLQEAGPESCSGGECGSEALADMPEAPHSWWVTAVDEAGHERSTDAGGFAVGTPPEARLTVAPDPALVGHDVVLDASRSHDANGPLARFEWDLDGDGEYERDSGTAAIVTSAFPLPGVMRVGVRVTDGVGRTGVARADVRVTERPGEPSSFGVTIDAGADFTRTPDVTLRAFSPPGTTAVEVANDGGFLEWRSFAPGAPIPWRLSRGGPERMPRTVYVRFRSGPFVSDPYSDDIVLDALPPTIAAARLAGAGGNGGMAASAGVRYILRTSARDSGSGVDGLQVTGDRRRPGRPRRFRSSVVVRTRAGRVWVRVLDRAGNPSRWRLARYSGPR